MFRLLRLTLTILSLLPMEGTQYLVEMAYNLQHRLDHAGERMSEVNGERVILSRGTSETPNVLVSPILKPAEELIPGIAITRVDYQAFGVNVLDYQIDGVPVSPKAGDLITRTDGSVYKLVSEGSNTPPYRYMTSSRKRYLLHTEMLRRPDAAQPFPES
jgi:hypothetical protein